MDTLVKLWDSIVLFVTTNTLITGIIVSILILFIMYSYLASKFNKTKSNKRRYK